MRMAFTTAIWAVLVLAGCGSGGADKTEAPSGGQSASLASLPATVEGTLVMSAGEGNEDEDGHEVLFGVLTVGGHEHYIEVAPALVDSAAITEDVAKVRVTLGSKQDLGGGVIQYTVTALEKL